MNLIWQTFAMSLLCFAIAQIASSGADESEAARKLCLERHKISEEEFASQNFSDKDVDKKYKCFGHCWVQELGFLDETGKVNAEKLQAYHPMNEKELAALMACKAKHDLEDDPCEYSHLMINCIM